MPHLHRSSPINDGSVASAGATSQAVATTSGGVAWSLGYPDGEQAPLNEVLEATGRMARAVDVPVTADLEAGYGASPEEVAGTVRAVIEAGAVGINLEDSSHHALREMPGAAQRIHAAREAAKRAGVPIVINARVDTYLLKYGASDAERFDETVRRAKAYLAAGADCVYPISLGDAPTLEALVKALDAPINVTARPGIPGVDELKRLGVARISTATRFTLIALSAVERAASALRQSGQFDCLAASVTHPDMQRLLGA